MFKINKNKINLQEKNITFDNNSKKIYILKLNNSKIFYYLRNM